MYLSGVLDYLNVITFFLTVNQSYLAYTNIEQSA